MPSKTYILFPRVLKNPFTISEYQSNHKCLLKETFFYDSLVNGDKLDGIDRNKITIEPLYNYSDENEWDL